MGSPTVPSTRSRLRPPHHTTERLREPESLRVVAHTRWDGDGVGQERSKRLNRLKRRL